MKTQNLSFCEPSDADCKALNRSLFSLCINPALVSLTTCYWLGVMPVA